MKDWIMLSRIYKNLKPESPFKVKFVSFGKVEGEIKELSGIC